MSDLNEILESARKYLKYKEKYSPVSIFENEITREAEYISIESKTEFVSEKIPTKQARTDISNDEMLTNEIMTGLTPEHEDWMDAKTLDELNGDDMQLPEVRPLEDEE